MIIAERNEENMIERWGIFEVSLRGPEEGNPFLDVELSAHFERDGQAFEVEGFYDGGGVYRLRFMPDEIGVWTYRTKSNRAALDGQQGRFTCIEPSPQNHGPVQVSNTHYLAYADGTPYFQLGTTCYAWAHQGDRMEEQTLETLAAAPFNKMRMCIFPKDYAYNKNEPVFYPFVGEPLKDWDFTRFNPAFWRHFEQRVLDLQPLGIEADIILFHTYDRWNFEHMDAASDDRYIRYALARLGAYRHVWWSLANEFDFMPSKKETDWDRFFEIIDNSDPYGRMRGIHNGRDWYDHTKPWVIHASLQTSDMAGGVRYRQEYQKPVIYDECRYEGDIPQGWGNINAREMTMRFWQGTLSGCYVGHGETYKHPEDLLWWAKGGVLRGASPARIQYLKDFIATAPPFEGLTPLGDDQGHYVLAQPGEYYLVNSTDPAGVSLELPGEQPYRVDGIDPWEMKIIPIGTVQPGKQRFSGPNSGYIYRLTPYQPGEKIRPQASAAASVIRGSVPLEVQFSAEGDLQCKWDFGDGASSNKPNPTHVYRDLGHYTVSLTVKDGEGLSAATGLSIDVLPAALENLDEFSDWPGSQTSLVFVWGSQQADNSILDEGGNTIRVCQMEGRGGAQIGSRGQMHLGEGAFLAKDVNDQLLDACKQSNQLSIECVIKTADLKQRGPARIATFSKDMNSRNFTLGQEGEYLVLRLRTPKTGTNGLSPEVKLAKIKANEPTHVIASYFSGNLYCYINGRMVFSGPDIQGDFSNWQHYNLLFGDEFSGGRNWRGELKGIAVYSRFVGLEEAAWKSEMTRR